MASRVYPVTRDLAKVEIILGLPTGTAARLAQWEKDNPEPPMFEQEAGYQRWQRLQADETLATLDHFITFGWGRVRHDLVGEEYSGEIKNGAEADTFLRKHGVALTPEQLLATEGICWG